MLAYETQNYRQEQIDLPSTEVPQLPTVSFTALDTVALAECLQVPLSEKDRLLHAKPTFLYPRNGLYGLL